MSSRWSLTGRQAVRGRGAGGRNRLLYLKGFTTLHKLLIVLNDMVCEYSPPPDNFHTYGQVSPGWKFGLLSVTFQKILWWTGGAKSDLLGHFSQLF